MELKPTFQYSNARFPPVRLETVSQLSFRDGMTDVGQFCITHSLLARRQV
jgi:hypothetical protein